MICSSLFTHVIRSRRRKVCCFQEFCPLSCCRLTVRWPVHEEVASRNEWVRSLVTKAQQWFDAPELNRLELGGFDHSSSLLPRARSDFPLGPRSHARLFEGIRDSPWTSSTTVRDSGVEESGGRVESERKSQSWGCARMEPFLATTGGSESRLEEGWAGAEVLENRTLSEPLLAINARKEDIRIQTFSVLAPVRERVASLDIFRGLTIAMMILSDDGGGAWPAINHSPWNGLTLADFVMPAFLFIVGLSISLAYKRVPSKGAATAKALSRTVKLWLLGVLLQGGYYHGLSELSYGINIQLVRWCGILQRIAVAYLVVTFCEIWNPRLSSSALPDGSFSIIKIYFWHWVVAGLLSTVYLVLLYGLYVPDWEFVPPSVQAASALKVTCGVRGDLSPPCNAVGYVDRFLLGINHLYKNPMYKRTPDCSVNSPDYGPMPPEAPNWCLAPFEPEGLLSSVSAIGSCFIGLHYGHILVHLKSHSVRVIHWSLPSIGLVVVGITLHFLGMPLNKPLYSLSYVFVTAGVAGLLFLTTYLLVDVYRIRWPMVLFEWMGLNSLLIFVLVACGVAAAAVQGFYWESPQYNLVTFIEEHGPWTKGVGDFRVIGVLEQFQA